MTKFGWFQVPTAKYPAVTYEGDYMEMEKEFVKIYKYGEAITGRMVAAIRLDKGQDVREIADSTAKPAAGD